MTATAGTGGGAGNARTRRCAVALLLLASGACGRFGIDQRDEHGTTALMRSARDGDAAECERLIARGAGVNARVPTRDLRELIAFLRWMQQLPHWDVGYTPLMYGVKGANPRVVRTLVEKGADVNATARGGDSALDLAIADSRGSWWTFSFAPGAASARSS